MFTTQAWQVPFDLGHFRKLFYASVSSFPFESPFELDLQTIIAWTSQEDHLLAGS